ncbi:hypothetical protein AMIS_56820 [Actinoplanes missouriensis 431]|uniref:Uncharacterized protein n=1 Tax=Actinoplanes missouriensis (strain ATCC 14538 / DSM 43046 / CBS 188.64 / JCM 3121 / NBRC 102363 / NCIMB 12654 / NRRL B-3342 / UNCC 431) TaxID=512565 RepID=I0HD15_ACTM4|nr:hypothetical protein [Actinoplanes missouriensis]BAL90902.1 hypothetical protein AMIS_56820 [Actinoplanes missouriensis 431]
MSRLAAACLAFFTILLACPAPASAHAGGLTATDARSRVVAVVPAVPGLSVVAIENGARLRLRNGTGAPVTIGGAKAGGGTRTADGSGVVVAPGATLTWIDQRATPDGRRVAAGETVDWSIPLTVGGGTAEAAGGGATVMVTGVLTGEQRPISPLWWAATALLIAAVLLAARRLPRGDLLLCVCGLVAAGASIAHVAGSTLAVESAPLIGTFLSAAGINLLAWPLIIGGAVTALRGRPAGVLAVCGGAALTAVFVLPDVTSFHRPVLPFAGPAVAERVLVVVALGLGAGVAVAGAGVLRELARQPAAMLIIGVLLLGGCTAGEPVRAVTTSCGSAAPDAVPVNVALRDGRAEPAPHRVAVPLNSTVLLGVTSDVAGEVHVHGYDLAYPVQAGQPACVLFAAGRAGLFDVEAHPSTLLVQIEVR